MARRVDRPHGISVPLIVGLDEGHTGTTPRLNRPARRGYDPQGDFGEIGSD